MAATVPQPIDWTATKMKYNRLGRSGLKVSALSLGSWTTFGNSAAEDTAYECMTVALKNGVNFFDNAEAYAGGQSETVMGKILQRWFAEGLCQRQDVVISTKIFWGSRMAGVKGNPNATGLSRKHLLEGIDASLKRLQLEYVDVLFCHRPDPSTPIEETVRAINHAIAQGKVLYWGTSEWSAQEIEQAHTVAERLGLIAPLAEQPQYNILHRTRFEVEYQGLFASHGMGTTTWSPLASGFLTGKYAPSVIPADSRLSHAGNDYLTKQFNEGKSVGGLEVKKLEDVYPKVDALKPIAEKLGVTLAVLSVAWVLKNPNVSTVILGASRPSQVVENLAALEVVDKLTADVMAEIDAAVGTKPTLQSDWGRGQLRID